MNDFPGRVSYIGLKRFRQVQTSLCFLPGVYKQREKS